MLSPLKSSVYKWSVMMCRQCQSEGSWASLLTLRQFSWTRSLYSRMKWKILRRFLVNLWHEFMACYGFDSWVFEGQSSRAITLNCDRIFSPKQNDLKCSESNFICRIRWRALKQYINTIPYLNAQSHKAAFPPKNVAINTKVRLRHSSTKWGHILSCAHPK